MAHEFNIKVAVVGLDGVPPKLLSSIIESEGRKLKFLYQASQSYGVHELTSVIPYISPAAWVSMFTGVYPVKHCIYDFFKLIIEDNIYELKPISIFDVKSKFIWEILGRYGYKSVVANIPSLYPAKKINGVMISGPPSTSLTTYPSYLKQILRRKYNYEVDIEDFNLNFIQNREGTLKKIIDIETKRIKTYKFLTRIFNKYSLFIYGFLFTDNILHFSFPDIISYLNGEKLNAPEEYHVLVRILKDIDELLNVLYKNVDIIILVSDHGMKSYKNMFLMNSWLIRQGYLSLKHTSSIIKLDRLFSSKHFYRIYRIISLLFPSLKHTLSTKIKRISKDRFDPSLIDLNNTIMFAYSSNMPVSLIKLHNINSKENEESIKDIKNRLNRELCKEIDCDVYSTEDIYRYECKGDKIMDVTQHPDLLVVSKSHVFSALRLHDAIVVDLKRKGDHDITGFIMYASKDNIELNVNKARIVDIAPTLTDLILHNFNIRNKPQTFDGKSLLKQ